MWFNNALIYKYELSEETDLASLLAQEALKPCPPHARFIYGWLSVWSDELVQEVAGASLICLGKEERILPRGVIKRMVTERVKALEIQQGRAVKRAEKSQIAEDIEFELLPKSFCVQKQLNAILDQSSNRLIINTSSENQAAQLTSLLRKTIPGLQIDPLLHPDNLALRFAEWISDPTLIPPCFTLASDCLLFSLEDDKKRITCKGYEMPAEEILTLLTQGLAVAEISLIWNERIHFTLTHDLTIKRLKSLDYLVDEFNDISQLEEEYEQRDAALALLSGELRQLTDDLLKSLNQTSKHTIEENELSMA